MKTRVGGGGVRDIITVTCSVYYVGMNVRAVVTCVLRVSCTCILYSIVTSRSA